MSIRVKISLRNKKKRKFVHIEIGARDRKISELQYLMNY